MITIQLTLSDFHRGRLEAQKDLQSWVCEIRSVQQILDEKRAQKSETHLFWLGYQAHLMIDMGS